MAQELQARHRQSQPHGDAVHVTAPGSAAGAPPLGHQILTQLASARVSRMGRDVMKLGASTRAQHRVSGVFCGLVGGRCD